MAGEKHPPITGQVKCPHCGNTLTSFTVHAVVTVAWNGSTYTYSSHTDEGVFCSQCGGSLEFCKRNV